MLSKKGIGKRENHAARSPPCWSGWTSAAARRPERQHARTTGHHVRLSGPPRESANKVVNSPPQASAAIHARDGTLKFPRVPVWPAAAAVPAAWDFVSLAAGTFSAPLAAGWVVLEAVRGLVERLQVVLCGAVAERFRDEPACGCRLEQRTIRPASRCSPGRNSGRRLPPPALPAGQIHV